jgi:hypothetical protein
MHGAAHASSNTTFYLGITLEPGEALTLTLPLLTFQLSYRSYNEFFGSIIDGDNIRPCSAFVLPRKRCHHSRNDNGIV